MPRPASLIPAVGYVRMSSSKQDKSPEQQRAEIIKHARNRGYKILRWYEDSGKSGGKETHRRTDFLRLFDDIEERGDFRAVIVWSRSRFDRLHAWESGDFKMRLAAGEIILDTISDGVFDFGKEDGEILDTFHSLKNHKDLLNISREVIRGKVDALLNRTRTHGGQPPYGMARRVVDDKGRVHVIPRGERFRTLDDWEVTYVEGDRDELKTVRWMFKTYDTKDVSPYWLAADLNRRGIPSPGGSKWRDVTIRRLLRDRAYVGDLVVGQKRTRESFHRLTPEGAKRNKGPRGRLAKGTKGEADELIVLAGRWEAVVDPGLFRRVQAKLDAVADTQRRPRSTDAGYPLSGILFCGHCGARLIGGRKALKDGTVNRYNCGRFMNAPGSCIGAKVDEPEIIGELVRVLGFHLSDDRIKELSVRQEAGKADPATGLKKRLAEIEKSIANGTRRVCSVDEDRKAAAIMAELDRLYAEKDQVAAELRNYTDPADVPALVKQWAERHEQTLYAVQAIAAGPVTEPDPLALSNWKIEAGEAHDLDPYALRRAFLEVGLRGDVHWTEREHRTRAGKYALDRVEISVDLNQLVTQHPSGRTRSAPR